MARSGTTKRGTNNPGASGAPGAKAAPPRIRTAILATDLSPGALGAAHAAGFVHQTLGAKIVVLVAVEAGTLPSGGKRAAAAWRARVAENVRAYADAHGLADAKIDVVQGDPTVETLKAIKKHKAGLIITGRRGAHGAAERVLGGTARRIVRKSPVSVLLARREFAGEVRAVGVSTDFSSGSDLALARAVDVARRIGLKHVDVLHAVEQPAGAMVAFTPEQFVEERREAAEEYVARHAGLLRAGGGPALRLSVGEGRPSDMLASLARTRRLSLLFLGSHGAGSTPFLLGSTAERVLDSTPCSIWVEKPEDGERTGIERLAAFLS